MNLYAIIVYGLFITAVCLSCASWIRTLKMSSINITKNAILIVVSLIIAFVPFGKYSCSMLLYSVFDTPSFLLASVCILTIIRSIFYQVNFTIQKQGMFFLFALWILFACNTLGYIDWFLGSITYRILIVGIFIAIGYCIDRMCGILMFLSFIAWIPCANFIDIYNALFDTMVCVGCIFIQSIPMQRSNFHIALLKPKFLKGL